MGYSLQIRLILGSRLTNMKRVGDFSLHIYHLYVIEGSRKCLDTCMFVFLLDEKEWTEENT